MVKVLEGGRWWRWETVGDLQGDDAVMCMAWGKRLAWGVGRGVWCGPRGEAEAEAMV